MKTLLSVLTFGILSISSWVIASELDNEASVTNQQIAAAKDLPATLVIRVDNGTSELAVLHSKVALNASSDSANKVVSSNFTNMRPSERMRTELDRDTSKSSWFFYFNPFYLTNALFFNPTYLYSGFAYNYTPYYSYYTTPYTYYYYRWWF